MKLSIGNVAEGNKYFERPKLNEKFWRLLEKSNHINIAAPRRIGKTSLMKDILNKGKDDYKIIYTITESINDANAYFEKMYKELLKILNNSSKFKQYIGDLYKKFDIKKISLTGVEFGKNDFDFYEEIKEILAKTKDSDEHIVMLIDEFSQTLENIIQDQGKAKGKLFLHQCRELRIDPSCKGNISFVYTGSVGLENLVASIDESKSITDIARFEMPTFTKEESLDFIEMILNNENYIFEKENKTYFLEKLQWLLPYIIQVMMSEIEEICIENQTKVITSEMVDEAYARCLKNRSYFEHWVSRLRVMFKKAEYSFVIDILNETAKKNEVSKFEYSNIATKYKIKYIDAFINMLEHDGYIVKNADTQKYRFNSPLLQTWWLQNMVN